VEDREGRQLVAELEARLEQLERLEEPAQSVALDAVQALLQVYGEALRRVVAGLDGEAAGLAEDELLSHLLVLHDLHPVPVEERIAQALDGVRPYLRSHGGEVELLAVEDGVARLRLEGSCKGCPSSAATLKLAIEDAIREAAPELAGIEAEGVAPPPPPLVQLGSFKHEETPADSAWTVLGGLPAVPEGGSLAYEVGGEPVLFLRLAGAFYAYRNRCAACSEALTDAEVAGVELACASCGERYDVRAAGRGLDGELHLEPVPLLVGEDGAVRVAIPAAVA
jgi:Fe-S cluster biogenesis protein NfuA/nitrite reductase/ring-hydroxylating ferredoxin subunit